MNSKLAGLLLGVTCVGLALASQNWGPAGADDGTPRTARMVRADRPPVSASTPAAAVPAKATTPSVAPPAAPAAEQSQTDALREENRRLQAKIERLEGLVELLKETQALPEPVATALEAPPAVDAPPPPPAQEAPSQTTSSQRTVRTRRSDQGKAQGNTSRTIVHIHRHEPCEQCAAAQRKTEEVQKLLEQAQREVKEVVGQREVAVSRAEAAEKDRAAVAQSLKAARQERDVAAIDAEAAARARDEALRIAEYSKKERDEAMRAADLAVKQAAEAAKNRDTAVNAAQLAARQAVKQATEDRDQARAEAARAAQDRETARRISQELQRQRLAAYEEAKAARAEIMPARQALAMAERQAEDRRQLAEQYRSAEHQWAQFAVQLAGAVGVTDLLPPQEERWSSRTASTQAWLAKVRQKHALALAQGARPSEGDRTGANFAYVEGLRHMRQQDYAAAVLRFSEAIDRNPNDARYFYLRGMARHLAGNGADLTEAERDVRRGAELEKQNSPSSRMVDQALERFQGATRLWAEKFRR